MHLMSKGNDYFSSTGSDNYGPVPVRCMFGVFRTTLFGTHNCQVWSRRRMPLTKYVFLLSATVSRGAVCFCIFQIISDFRVLRDLFGLL